MRINHFSLNSEVDTVRSVYAPVPLHEHFHNPATLAMLIGELQRSCSASRQGIPHAVDPLRLLPLLPDAANGRERFEMFDHACVERVASQRGTLADGD